MSVTDCWLRQPFILYLYNSLLLLQFPLYHLYFIYSCHTTMYTLPVVWSIVATILVILYLYCSLQLLQYQLYFTYSIAYIWYNTLYTLPVVQHIVATTPCVLQLYYSLQLLQYHLYFHHIFPSQISNFKSPILAEVGSPRAALNQNRKPQHITSLALAAESDLSIQRSSGEAGIMSGTRSGKIIRRRL